jgi:hypothetical protein
MKLLPLSAKKKLSRFMHWFDFFSILFVTVGGLFGGLASVLTYDAVGGDKQQKAALQEKVDHLLQSYKMSQSMHTVVVASEKGAKLGLDLPVSRAGDKSLNDAFNAEAQSVGIALAHARGLSPNQRYELYKPLQAIQPLPDYFRKMGKDADFTLFSWQQSEVMNRPGFTPTLESAREIAGKADYGGLVAVGAILGPPLLGGCGIFAFCAMRRRLDKSIERDEDDLTKEKEAVEKAEAQRQAEEAARKAVEAAEAERIAKLPPSVSLERDIAVKQIKIKLSKGGS